MGVLNNTRISYSYCIYNICQFCKHIGHLSNIHKPNLLKLYNRIIDTLHKVVNFFLFTKYLINSNFNTLKSKVSKILTLMKTYFLHNLLILKITIKKKKIILKHFFFFIIIIFIYLNNNIRFKFYISTWYIFKIISMFDKTRISNLLLISYKYVNFKA